MRDDLDGAPFHEAFARARAAWPGVDVAEPVFQRWLAERLRAEGSLDTALAELNVGDLYLACACARGDARALAALDVAYGEELRTVHRRFGYQPGTADDVKQGVYERLFVGPNARISTYQGRGALRVWLRVAAVRVMLNQAEHAGREVPADDELLAATVDTTDPEVARLRTAYGELIRQAFGEAVETLSVREKNLLRYAFVDGLSVDRIGAVYGVHRATAARWVASARTKLGDGLRAVLLERLGVPRGDLESAVRLALDGVELSLARYFARAKQEPK